ncbi:uncharacterized protein LOC132747247 [Ruditapes philippinarum]|uniref:uncharacterized protein LOC132747247 n=1 Tax=Ruditapes philippinarum TaxID=129788 RepID=UPI00295AEA02|nr:uncharacterized protein LOC132747247 [Ruditapes philippinarum]
MHMKSLDREVNTLLDCDHPNVIKIYGIIQREAGVIDVLLESWGESLKAYLKRFPRKIYPKTITIRSWFYQILSGLDYLHHCKQLVHCDIHPGNVLIWKDVIKVCDFGSIKKIGERHGTQSHGISPMYFPPTVLRHYLEKEIKQYDYQVSLRLDTFAVGKLLLELMRGGKIIEIEEMRPYIYDKNKWDAAVKVSIPEGTPFEIKQVIIGLMGFTTKDSMCTIEDVQILLK